MANKNSRLISVIKKELKLLIEFLYERKVCIECVDYAINSINSSKEESSL